MASAPALQKSRLLTGLSQNMESRLDEDKSALKELDVLKARGLLQKIHIVELLTGKGLTKEQIFKVAQSQLRAIEKCLTEGKLSGKLKLNLTINPDGTVKDVEIASFDFKEAEPKQCLIAEVRHWRIPSTANSRIVKATIVFMI